MPYSVQWQEPNRVIHHIVTGNFTVEEASRANEELCALLDASTETVVHIIADITELTHFPTQLGQVRSVGSYLSHSKMGWLILVGSMGPLLNFVISVMTQVARIQYRRADDLDGALAALTKLEKSNAAR